MEIVIGQDDMCTCGCQHKCLLGKCGSALRCTKEELEKEGYETLKLPLYKKTIFGLYKLIKKEECTT
jgi:hypothetical protein